MNILGISQIFRSSHNDLLKEIEDQIVKFVLNIKRSLRADMEKVSSSLAVLAEKSRKKA